MPKGVYDRSKIKPRPKVPKVEVDDPSDVLNNALRALANSEHHREIQEAEFDALRASYTRIFHIRGDITVYIQDFADYNTELCRRLRVGERGEGPVSYTYLVPPK